MWHVECYYVTNMRWANIPGSSLSSGSVDMFQQQRINTNNRCIVGNRVFLSSLCQGVTRKIIVGTGVCEGRTWVHEAADSPLFDVIARNSW